ncbi:putative disease resistance protein At5g47280 [Nymphaea colorata]|nr:putative disease resistance protein At5g47280 [Nymphaea colorata]
MTEIAAGAAAGLCAQEWWNIIKRVFRQPSEFKKQYKDLERVLEELRPVLDKHSTNPELEALRCEMRNGRELISKCAKVGCWNILKQNDYSSRLQQQVKAIQNCRDTAILSGVLELNSKLPGGGEVAGLRSVAALPPLLGKVFGIEKPLTELKGMLKRNQVVGVYGMVGCGKTTLVNVLCRDPDIEGASPFYYSITFPLFVCFTALAFRLSRTPHFLYVGFSAVSGLFRENIFYFKVSKSPDTLHILEGIWSQLLVEKVPRFKDVEDAVRQVAHGLSKQPIKYSGDGLIFLDDVWSEKDLKNLLFRTERLKTIFTSREIIKIKPHEGEIYSLPNLEEEAAKELFYHVAGNPSPIYTSAAEQIIKRCGGLPLALELIGGSLNDEPIERWQAIRKDLLNEGDIYKSEKDLLSYFSKTIDSLSPQLQECFLDLGSFPEDKRLTAPSIIDMWVELYGLTEENAFLELSELSKKHLLNLTWRTRSHTIDGGNYHDIIVSQHDLLRHLALHYWTMKGRTERKRVVVKGKEGGELGTQNHQEIEAPDAEIVSLQGCEANNGRWSNREFRNAKVLMLNFSGETYQLPPFLGIMENLKVLIITNHSLNQAKLQMGGNSLSNLRRMRLERISVAGLFEIENSLLRSLHKLSLFFCEFSQSSSDSAAQNIPAIFPGLKELEIHYAADLLHLPPAVCEARSLRKLSVTKCPALKSLPQRMNQLTNLEFLNIYACSSLEGLPDSICELKHLRVLDLCDCCMIERLPENLGSLSCLARIDMRRCLKIDELPESVTQIEDLESVVCDEAIRHLWDQVIGREKVYVPEEETNLNFLR